MQFRLHCIHDHRVVFLERLFAFTSAGRARKWSHMILELMSDDNTIITAIIVVMTMIIMSSMIIDLLLHFMILFSIFLRFRLLLEKFFSLSWHMIGCIQFCFRYLFIGPSTGRTNYPSVRPSGLCPLEVIVFGLGLCETFKNDVYVS